MKKIYEAPKSKIITLTSMSFLESSGNGFGGEVGDMYAFDRFDSEYGKSF